MHTMNFRTTQLGPEDAEDLHAYINTLPVLPLLTPEQEAAADPNTLVEHNIRLSILAACKYAGRGVPVVDLVQEGNIGLMRAAESFNASKGRFSTYAMQSVAQHVKRAVHNYGSTIRLPVWAQDGSKRADISEAARELVNTIEVVSGDEERVRRKGRNNSDGAVTLLHMAPDTTVNTEAEAIERAAADERRALVGELLELIPTRQRLAIDMHLFKGLSWRDIGRELGCSHEQARTLYTVAVRRLRELVPAEAIDAL